MPQLRFSIPSETIETIGVLLYGRQWQRPLAQRLGVSDMSVRRWRDGRASVPGRAIEEMESLIDGREQDLETAKRRLRSTTRAA